MVNFHNIPSNLREPLFYAELDATHANTAGSNLRALLIGQKTNGGDAVANTPVISAGLADARARFGAGSQLHMMVDAYLKNDGFGELWCLPLADDGAAVAAVGSVTFGGPATATGVLSLYVAGILVPVVVPGGMTANQLATAAAAAITANPDLPVSGVVDGVTLSKINITAKNLGLAGNDIDIRVNYRGLAGGEALPAGITAAIVPMANGATNPVLTGGLANLNDAPFEFIAMPYTDATSLAAMKAFLDDVAGRWSWQVQLFGHCLIAKRGTFGASTTFGLAQNDQHLTCLPFNDSPSPNWVWAAALAAQVAVSVRADQAQPIRGVALAGVLAPPLASRYTLSQRNTLLFDGLSTFTVEGGSVILSKIVTTYQLNAFGAADNSYLDAETLFNLAGVLRELRSVVTSKYGRSKLADDTTFLIPGTNVVTPAIIKADIIAKYRELEARALVQNEAAFAAALVVQKNATNPNRVDVLWPGVLVDRLDVFALLAQFRLQ
jgi:phage tail sheath gpL-like